MISKSYFLTSLPLRQQPI